MAWKYSVIKHVRTIEQLNIIIRILVDTFPAHYLGRHICRYQAVIDRHIYLYICMFPTSF